MSFTELLTSQWTPDDDDDATEHRSRCWRRRRLAVELIAGWTDRQTESISNWAGRHDGEMSGPVRCLLAALCGSGGSQQPVTGRVHHSSAGTSNDTAWTRHPVIPSHW